MREEDVKLADLSSPLGVAECRKNDTTVELFVFAFYPFAISSLAREAVWMHMSRKRRSGQVALTSVKGLVTVSVRLSEEKFGCSCFGQGRSSVLSAASTKVRSRLSSR